MFSFNRIIAVVLILLLILALILINTFGSGILQLKTFTEARSICEATGKSLCKSFGDMPFSWITNKINTKIGWRTCAEIMGCDTCESCGYI